MEEKIQKASSLPSSKPKWKTKRKPGRFKGSVVLVGDVAIVSLANGKVMRLPVKDVMGAVPRKSRPASTSAPRDPVESAPRDPVARIRAMLVEHFGSQRAADAWLDSPDTGYITTARDAIRGGHADYVLRDLRAQWGPNPPYA